MIPVLNLGKLNQQQQCPPPPVLSLTPRTHTSANSSSFASQLNHQQPHAAYPHPANHSNGGGSYSALQSPSATPISDSHRGIQRTPIDPTTSAMRGGVSDNHHYYSSSFSQAPPDSSRSGISTGRAAQHEISALRSGAVDTSRLMLGMDVTTIHDVPTLQKLLHEAYGTIMALDAWYGSQLGEKERHLSYRLEQLMLADEFTSATTPHHVGGGSGRSAYPQSGGAVQRGSSSVAGGPVRRAGSPSLTTGGRPQSPLKAHLPFTSSTNGRPPTASALTARTASSQQRLEALATPTRRASSPRPATARSPGKSPLVGPSSALHSRPFGSANAAQRSTVSSTYVGPSISPRGTSQRASTTVSAYNTPLSTPRRQKTEPPTTPGRSCADAPQLTATGKTLPGGAPPSSNYRQVVNWSSSIPYVPPSNSMHIAPVATPAQYERPASRGAPHTSYAQSNFNTASGSGNSRGYVSASVGAGTAVRTTFGIGDQAAYARYDSGETE